MFGVSVCIFKELQTLLTTIPAPLLGPFPEAIGPVLETWPALWLISKCQAGELSLKMLHA